MYASILEISWTLLFTIINLSILLFFMKKLLFKSVNNIFESRRKEIEDNLTNAQKSKDEANSLKQQYEEQIKLARGEAKNIVDTATTVASKKSDEIIEDARNRAKKIEEKSNEDILNQKRMAFDSLKTEISVIAVDIASKVIKKDINTTDHSKLIDDVIDNVGEAKW